MTYLRANWATKYSGGSGRGTVLVQRRLGIDAAKLAGSIVIFKKKGEFVVE